MRPEWGFLPSLWAFRYGPYVLLLVLRSLVQLDQTVRALEQVIQGMSIHYKFVLLLKSSSYLLLSCPTSWHPPSSASRLVQVCGSQGNCQEASPDACVFRPESQPQELLGKKISPYLTYRKECHTHLKDRWWKQMQKQKVETYEVFVKHFLFTLKSFLEQNLIEDKNRFLWLL